MGFSPGIVGGKRLKGLQTVPVSTEVLVVGADRQVSSQSYTSLLTNIGGIGGIGGTFGATADTIGVRGADATTVKAGGGTLTAAGVMLLSGSLSAKNVVALSPTSAANVTVSHDDSNGLVQSSLGHLHLKATSLVQSLSSSGFSVRNSTDTAYGHLMCGSLSDGQSESFAAGATVYNGLKLSSGYYLNWGNSTTLGSTTDTRIGRNSAGQVDITHVSSTAKLTAGHNGTNSFLNSSAGTLQVTQPTTSTVALTIKQVASTTANAFEINSSTGSGGNVYRISSSGQTIAANDFVTTGSVGIGMNGTYSFTSRGGLRMTANGKFQLGDNSFVDLLDGGMLLFGSALSTRPAQKRSGAALQDRLADDSGFADRYCRDLISSRVVYATTDFENLTASGGVIIRSPNNTRYRIAVDNSGVLSTTAL